MNENDKLVPYKILSNGHVFQVRTGPGPDYNESYSKERYDSYTTTDKMSELRYNLIRNHIGSINSVCDFGYGNGSFLKYCHQQGLKTYGYDISNYELPAHIQKINDPDSVEVDVMTFFDSLEHLDVEDLVPVLKSKKANYFIISVPWFHESCGEEWFMNWKHRRVNEHFHHFDVDGLIQLLVDVGCKILHVGNDEDKIRKPYSDLPNILTIVAQKEKSFKQLYEESCRNISDINEHISTLYEYASKCKHITEMGVREGVSTTAFLYANPEKLISYDLYPNDNVRRYFNTAKKLKKDYHYIIADVLNVEIEPTDLLFIDTLHSYKQIKQELKLHANKVRKYIVFHDIVTWGERGESWQGLNNEDFWKDRNDSVGIVPAIEEFLQENPQWQKIHWAQNNNGLGIIERIGEKKE